jgi:hypothetical protein
MATIWRIGLSTSEAECFLADVWCILEASQSASPHISVVTCPDGQLDIRLDFDRRQDAELVESRLGSPGKRHQFILMARGVTSNALEGARSKNAMS